MKRESWSIIGACLLGAFIGTVVALDISTRFQYGSYFWGIGALFGGIGILLATMSSVFIIVLGAQLIPDLLALVMAFVSIVPFAAVLAFASMSRNNDEETTDYIKRLEENRDKGWEMMLYCNPIGILYWMLVGFGWVAVRTPHAVTIGALTAYHAVINGVRTTRLFVARVFIYVHSERRTLCFVDTTFGIAVGYFYGDATIGAIAGAALGLVNYELVSVRWLKFATQPVQGS